MEIHRLGDGGWGHRKDMGVQGIGIMRTRDGRAGVRMNGMPRDGRWVDGGTGSGRIRVERKEKGRGKTQQWKAYS